MRLPFNPAESAGERGKKSHPKCDFFALGSPAAAVWSEKLFHRLSFGNATANPEITDGSNMTLRKYGKGS
jgi:hypothetical protein